MDNTTGYDIIGDIHGCYRELVLLLEKLGYVINKNGVYSHPEGRVAVFVGDYVDRGSDIANVLRLIKAMHDSKNALCIIGNHEYNACRFWVQSDTGNFLRKHTHSNIIQHYQTIKAFQNNEDEWFMYLKWFETLPFYIDHPLFRVVHACWDDKIVDMYPEGRIDLYNRRGCKIVEKCLKGDDIELPNGMSYNDKDGNKRTSARTKWWLNPRLVKYIDYIENTNFPEGTDQTPLYLPILDIEKYGTGYSADNKPVFFGHYWLRGVPIIQASNVCCLDYSVAKGDKLVCYRFDGEQTLNVNKIVYHSNNETIDQIARHHC